jgi:hypothetical protein
MPETVLVTSEAGRLGGLPGPGSAAVALTKRLLRDIALGRFDPAAWSGSRQELLSSPERKAALDRHRQGIGPATTPEPRPGG